MAKLIVDEKPVYEEDCPLHKLGVCKFRHNNCPCVGGYMDYRTFDFKKCPFLTTADNVEREQEYEDEYENEYEW